MAAAAKGKAIFCEKPIDLDLRRTDECLAAVEKAGVPFQIGFNRRFDPAHAAVREAVASGAVGEPHLVRISSRDPEPPPVEYIRTSGGLFLDMMIHDFDMARYVTASDVVEVFARGAVRVDPAFERAADVDTALVTLVHENGCLTAIDNSRRAAYGYDQRVEVFGSGGMAASENPLAHTARVFTANQGVDQWHVLYAWHHNGSLYALSEHVAPPYSYAGIVHNMHRMLAGLVLVAPTS